MTDMDFNKVDGLSIIAIEGYFSRTIFSAEGQAVRGSATIIVSRQRIK